MFIAHVFLAGLLTRHKDPASPTLAIEGAEGIKVHTQTFGAE